METDRGAVLTIRSATRGLLDFRQARILDVRWWRKVNTVLKALARDDELETTKLAFAYQLALVGNPALEKKGWEEAQARARELFREAFGTIKPWAKQSLAESEQTEVNGLIDAYRKNVGDPRDPEFKAKLDADLAADRARRAALKNRGESEADRVERLVRERDARTRVRR